MNGIHLRFPSQSIQLKGIIFDLDGTLTKPTLDFAWIKEKLGLPRDANIIEAIEKWPNESDRQWGHQMVEEWEADALNRFEFEHCVPDLLGFLDRHQILRAVVTRNNSQSLSTLDENLSTLSIPSFHINLSRSFQPMKPSPAPLLHIFQEWQQTDRELALHNILMVGDGRDDIKAGRAAGMPTCFLHTHTTSIDSEIMSLADCIFPSLNELYHHLRDFGYLSLGESSL